MKATLKPAALIARMIGAMRHRQMPQAGGQRYGPSLGPGDRIPCGCHHRISKIASISTATPKGNEAADTAERACRPASPKAAARKSDAPLITLG